LERQRAHDLMWIREPFLSSDRDWGVRVVHGHVIEPQPVFRANRIGLDTGAYQSGVLTCGVFERDEVRVLQTGPVKRNASPQTDPPNVAYRARIGELLTARTKDLADEILGELKVQTAKLKK
jgi:hypothetical protein